MTRINDCCGSSHRGATNAYQLPRQSELSSVSSGWRCWQVWVPRWDRSICWLRNGRGSQQIKYSGYSTRSCYWLLELLEAASRSGPGPARKPLKPKSKISGRTGRVGWRLLELVKSILQRSDEIQLWWLYVLYYLGARAVE